MLVGPHFGPLLALEQLTVVCEPLSSSQQIGGDVVVEAGRESK